MNETVKPYYTVGKPGEAEFTEKKSRFIGRIVNVPDEHSALEWIASIRKKHSDATHNVYAYTLRKDGTLRFSDDGEPSGTAGKPVLEVLTRAGLSDVVCTVTRYFGGTLLGAGGLTRAYANAAAMAVNTAVCVNMRPCASFTLTLSYSLWPRAERLCGNWGIHIENVLYGADVTVAGSIEQERYGALSDAIKELSSGQALPVFIGTVLLPCDA